jgi:Bacterial TSP3 repeat
MAVTDTDGDGISDAWERENTATMLTPGDLTTLTAAGDADGDGVSDKAEYAADSDPLDSTDFLRVLSLNRIAGGTELVWTSRPTRLYLVRDSLALELGWNPPVLGPITPDAGATTARTAPHAPSLKRFFQVQSRVPLQP